MLLTDDEMRIVREAVEIQAGFDPELIKTCSHLIHIKAFDEAVRNAFVLLEERMRKILKKENATGYQLAQFAFSANGPFTKLLAHNQLELEGTRDLFYGAFRLFRNPAAHTNVNYNAGEARSIISLIDLLLTQLNKLKEMPQYGQFPANVEAVLQLLEQQIGLPSTNRIRGYLSQCLKLNMQPRDNTKQWISFRKQARVTKDQGKTTRAHPVTFLYLTTSPKEQGLWFPVNQYYAQIIGIDREKVIHDLRDIGFRLQGEVQDPYISLNSHHDQEFIDKLLAITTQISITFDKSFSI